MSLVAEVWREVGRHLTLEDSLRRLAPVVARTLPVEAILVRRFDREPARFTTIASASSTADGTLDLPTTRTEVDPLAARELVVWLSTGQAVAIDRGHTFAHASMLLPMDLRRTAIALPLTIESRPLGVVLLLANASTTFTPAELALAQELAEPISVAFENDQRLNELARMREALEADRRALLSRLDRQDITDTVVGDSAGLNLVMERAEQVAKTDAPVLILGETGSGKEVIARAIHSRSRRAQGPVVRVNCGAIPAQLIDSELFGHERGSFTGAVGTRKGWFERADGGTLFLDEIGELPLDAQVRLLRVLQDGSLERVGGHQAITVDVRIVAATHRNLEAMVAEGKFREDLWYRISVFPIRLPALRERQEDIPALAAHFAKRAGVRLGGGALVPTERDVALLSSYAWPGNVRELASVIERATILGNGKRLEVAKALGTYEPVSALPPAPRPPTTPPPPTLVSTRALSAVPAANAPISLHAARGPGEIAPLDAAMIGHIERALEASHGRIEGPFGAAKVLGINPHTLRARMRKLGIEWSRFRSA